ncbi:hypothetical protein H7Y40_00490 [Pedobacter sp.]|nr:hypothetical protein [Candidatus Saccharibacteria bacterium]
MSVDKKQISTRDEKTRNASIVIVIMLVIVALVAAYFIKTPIAEPIKNDVSDQQAVLAKYSDFKNRDSKISLEQTFYGIEITNHETDSLTKCKVTVNSDDVNDGWSTNRTLVSGENVLITWGEFTTKDGDKFDPDSDEYTIKKVYIGQCDNPYIIKIFKLQ